MKELAREYREPVGSRVRLRCGHRWRQPWGLPPEAVVADLLQHVVVCALGSNRSAGDREPRGWRDSPVFEEARP